MQKFELEQARERRKSEEIKCTTNQTADSSEAERVVLQAIREKKQSLEEHFSSAYRKLSTELEECREEKTYWEELYHSQEELVCQWYTKCKCSQRDFF